MWGHGKTLENERWPWERERVQTALLLFQKNSWELRGILRRTLWRWWWKTVNLSNTKKCPLPLCVTEQEPNICLSGNSHDRVPLLIPLTFAGERVEWFDNNKCVMVFTCTLLRGWELREPGGCRVTQTAGSSQASWLLWWDYLTTQIVLDDRVSRTVRSQIWCLSS